jgi:cytochrome c553
MPLPLKTICVVAAGVALATSISVAQTPDLNKPEWAYAVAPGAPIAGQPRGRGAGAPGAGGAGPGATQQARAGGGGGGGGRAADPTLRTLPGSRFTFTTAQVRNGFGPADWFPEDHPAMPDIVAKGRQPNVRACGFCHMPNGKGRPENAPVAGLPKDYIVRQMQEFASGLRKTSEPRKPNDMGGIAVDMTPAEMEDAAAYFASMKWTPWIRVVETAFVKPTRIAGQMYHLGEGEATEPIGVRIVEAPEDEAQEQLRSPRSGFVAYVPPGAIKRGEALATTGGGGKTLACSTCHGADLRGIGPIPGLANRSPSYLGRQIYDFKQGTRKGSMAALMMPVVEKLTAADIVDLLAYTASREP